MTDRPIIQIMASEYTRNNGQFIGKESLERIKKDVEDIREEKGNSVDIHLYFSGVSMRDNFNVYIARLGFEYGCKLYGLSTKKEDIDYIIKSGYFIKKRLGARAYGNRLVELIQRADYPLMIKDRRGEKFIGNDVTYYIIQPYGVDSENIFHYGELRPKYADPIELERAVRDNKDIWNMKEIFVPDLGNESTGIRFASTPQERIILDLLSGVFSGTLEGFSGR